MLELALVKPSNDRVGDGEAADLDVVSEFAGLVRIRDQATTELPLLPSASPLTPL